MMGALVDGRKIPFSLSPWACPSSKIDWRKNEKTDHSSEFAFTSEMTELQAPQ
jgi:hypothetical protein